MGFFILQKQLARQGMFLIRSNISITAYLFLVLYRSTLQPYSRNHFSKILRPFCASMNKWIIVVFLQRTLKEKLPFILINTLLLHISLLALTHPQTEKWIYLLCVGWRNFFQLCCCVSFLVLAGNRFWCYILTYLEYNTVVALC